MSSSVLLYCSPCDHSFSLPYYGKWEKSKDSASGRGAWDVSEGPLRTPVHIGLVRMAWLTCRQHPRHSVSRTLQNASFEICVLVLIYHLIPFWLVGMLSPCCSVTYRKEVRSIGTSGNDERSVGKPKGDVKVRRWRLCLSHCQSKHTVGKITIHYFSIWLASSCPLSADITCSAFHSLLKVGQIGTAVHTG